MSINDSFVGVFFLIGFFSLIPAILVMCTSFTRIIIVLSLLRQAMGAPTIPPNLIVIGLALFMTFFIMSSTLDTLMAGSIQPYLEKKIDVQEALKRAETPVKSFMLRQTREKDIALFLGLAKVQVPETPQELPMRVVAPAFAISELKTAFEIGFLIYLPFLIIDMVVSSILLSMGMMMIPPVMVSLPFKLLLFVLVDGWNLIVGSLVRSFQ